MCRYLTVQFPTWYVGLWAGGSQPRSNLLYVPWQLTLHFYTLTRTNNALPPVSPHTHFFRGQSHTFGAMTWEIILGSKVTRLSLLEIDIMYYIIMYFQTPLLLICTDLLFWSELTTGTTRKLERQAANECGGKGSHDTAGCSQRVFGAKNL